MDFIQGLDPSKLVLTGVTLSFVMSAFAAPPYNLPIFLFGAYAVENSEAHTSLQTTTLLLGGSMIWDIIWMSRNGQNGFIRFLTILLLILKIPTIFAAFLSLRQRGASRFGVGNLGIGGGDLSGPTVWSMPGGFTSAGREGYQSVDDPEERPQPASSFARPQPASAPQAKASSPTQTSASAAYQSV